MKLIYLGIVSLFFQHSLSSPLCLLLFFGLVSELVFCISQISMTPITSYFFLTALLYLKETYLFVPSAASIFVGRIDLHRTPSPPQLISSMLLRETFCLLVTVLVLPWIAVAQDLILDSVP